jgi:hypothetical protein
MNPNYILVILRIINKQKIILDIILDIIKNTKEEVGILIRIQERIWRDNIITSSETWQN